MRTWREIREELVTGTNVIATVIEDLREETHFYAPIESQFCQFDGIKPEEQEVICEEEMRMLLSGFQTDNLRIQFDSRSSLPQCLNPNPALDPYIRSAVERFSEIIRDIYIIRVYGHEICMNLLRSRIARVIVGKIRQKLDDLLTPILLETCLPRQPDEGFHDSEYGLNGLTRCVASIKSSLHCFAEIVLSIYEKNLSGGEIIDLLEEKHQMAIRDRQEIHMLVKEAWKIFFELAGSWISYGQLSGDINREFFIWPANQIKSIDIEMLVKEHTPSDSRYLMIPGLCPKPIRPYALAIYQCGQNFRPDVQAKQNWTTLETPAAFIQKVLSMSTELSSLSLKQMRNEDRLDEFLQCFFATMLNSPWLASIAATLTAKGLPNRMYNEVADGVLKSLTNMTLHMNAAYLPLMKEFKFAKDRTSIFDALVRCQYIANSKSSMRTRSESQPTLADRLTISVSLPPGLERTMTPDVIYNHGLIFRLQLKIMLAAITLDEKKAELCRHRVRMGVQDDRVRQPLQLLHHMWQYLMRFRLKLFNAVRDATKMFYEKLGRAGQVEDVGRIQRDCLMHIFKEGHLREENIYIIEDLIGLIESFAADYTFDQLFEAYNQWLECVESSRFLNDELTSFA